MAAAAARSGHRSVFVGNIPYKATEEQLVKLCEEIGPVVSFKLVLDQATGRPKGYGFCEYPDEETALSAVRNMHGYQFYGRQLRVNLATHRSQAPQIAPEAPLSGTQSNPPIPSQLQQTRCNSLQNPNFIHTETLSSPSLISGSQIVVHDNQIPAEVESIIWQQFMSLTPEQLKFLPKEQLVQVLQIQKDLQQQMSLYWNR